MALQPGLGQSLLLLGFHPEGFLVGKCAFCSEWPAQSWYDCQSHLAVNQETWVSNGRWILLTKHLY
jgi:hypothetical protein